MNPITHAGVRLERELRKQRRGQIKEWWGKLTDDDLDLTAGNAKQIVGLLQQKHGYPASAPKRNSTGG